MRSCSKTFTRLEKQHFCWGSPLLRCGGGPPHPNLHARGLWVGIDVSSTTICFPKENDGLTLLYARVSSRDQVEDLARQTDTLQAHCTEKHWSNLHTIQDIGSGLNTRKPGLRKLISLVLARKVKRLVIMHKDRLLRFANDLLLDLCRSFGVEVLVLRHEEKDAQAQWCESIVEIMTVFCSSLYGKRSHKNRRAAAVQLAP